MKKCAFIHTNHRQYLGALVSEYSMRRYSKHDEEFDVKIIHVDDHPFLRAREGQSFLRGGTQRIWHIDDLQSFTPLRYMPPELMGYEGRAIVVDPDVFAIGDVYELLSRDMQGKALMARLRSKKANRDPNGKLASSVMLLDCAKLTHWRCRETFDAMFRDEVDYMDWISLALEPRETVGILEDEWNDLDRLTPKTKLLHTTKRRTQPWKTGLPVDFVPAETYKSFPPMRWIMRARRRLLGDYALLGHYMPHPDPNQERFFFGLLRECVEKGVVSEDMLRDEMKQSHIRPDAFEVLERTPPLAA